MKKLIIGLALILVVNNLNADLLNKSQIKEQKKCLIEITYPGMKIELNLRNIAVYTKREAVGSYEITFDKQRFYVNKQVSDYLKNIYDNCK